MSMPILYAAMKKAEATPLLQVENLVVRYRSRRRTNIAAVDNVSFQVNAGQTLAIVGESGSGKSSIGKAVLGLVAPSSGSIRFQGKDIVKRDLAMRRQLASQLQVIFQDPYSSLNPARTVGNSLIEPLLVRGALTLEQARERARSALARVGMPADTAARYPSAFSGGQRQRIAIARALVMKPKLVICDEPVSALDLSVQAQVLNLLVELQERDGISYLLISHDLSIVRYMSHHALVLQKGQVVESGTGEQLWSAPRHPYTRALLAAIPQPDPSRRRNTVAVTAMAV